MEKGVSIESVDEILVDEVSADNVTSSGNEPDGASTIIPNLEIPVLTRRSSHLSLYRKPVTLKNIQAVSPKSSPNKQPASPSKSPRSPTSARLSPAGSFKDSAAGGASPLQFSPKLSLSPIKDRSSSFYRKTGEKDSPVSILRASMNKLSPGRKRATIDLSPNGCKPGGLKYMPSFHISMQFPSSPKIHVLSEKETSRFDKILNDSKASAEFKSSLILYFLTTHLASRYFTVSQMAVIMEIFSIGMVSKTSFGSYRVELLVFLFGRILDLHNIHQILRVLTAEVSHYSDASSFSLAHLLYRNTPHYSSG
jgi:hypothetical protein